jgi:hypothetical protein
MKNKLINFKQKKNCIANIDYADLEIKVLNWHLNDLAKYYHEKAEQYDQTVCTAVNKHGEAMPRTPSEHRKVNQNAKNLKAKILDDNPFITYVQLRKAISHYPS